MRGALFPSVVCVMAAMPSAIHAQQSCSEVYAAAVRNISIDARTFVEHDYLYNQYCSVSGELTEASAGLDLTIPVKQIQLGFSGSQSEARQRMAQFCHKHRSFQSQRSAVLSLQNTVAADALRLLNECRALEINQIYISHSVQEPRSVIIHVNFNPALTNVRLRGIAYDANFGECRTTALNGGGEPRVIGVDWAEAQMDRPFSVICERAGVPTKTGATKFERFSIGLDTNHGPYSVIMPPEELAGYDLASKFREDYEALLSERNATERDNITLRNGINSLQGRINNASAELHIVRQGRYAATPWEHVVCPQNGGDVQAHARNVCGARKVVLSPRLRVHSGDRCGYSYYAYACMNVD